MQLSPRQPNTARSRLRDVVVQQHDRVRDQREPDVMGIMQALLTSNSARIGGFSYTSEDDQIAPTNAFASFNISSDGTCSASGNHTASASLRETGAVFAYRSLAACQARQSRSTRGRSNCPTPACHDIQHHRPIHPIAPPNLHAAVGHFVAGEGHVATAGRLVCLEGSP